MGNALIKLRSVVKLYVAPLRSVVTTSFALGMRFQSNIHSNTHKHTRSTSDAYNPRKIFRVSQRLQPTDRPISCGWKMLCLSLGVCVCVCVPSIYICIYLVIYKYRVCLSSFLVVMCSYIFAHLMHKYTRCVSMKWEHTTRIVLTNVTRYIIFILHTHTTIEHVCGD